jgi:hypothetical protein
LTAAPQIKPTSTRCHSAWQPKPGRGSTYRRGDFVQTSGTSSDKKEALDDLNEALKAPAPAIENKGNIDLVGKYYDKLAEALGADQQ